MRPGATPAEASVGSEELAIDASEHPLFKRTENVIGVIQSARKGAPQMVERPDGRLKRYFTVAGMKEPKQIAKRDTTLPNLNLLVDTDLVLPNEQEINTNVLLIENT